MKIVVVNEKCGYFGGVEQNIADTITGLLKVKGHESFLMYRNKTDINSKYFSDLFTESFQIDFTNTEAQNKKITDICSNIQPDAIYFHKCGNIQPFQRIIASYHSVRMVHDHDICCPRKHKYYSYSKRICHNRAGLRCWLDAAFLKREKQSRLGFAFNSIGKHLEEMKRNYLFSRMLVGSHFMKKELTINGFQAEHIHILPPMGYHDVQEGPTRYPQANELLYVGQLIHGKGVDLMLKALKLVSVDFRLTIIGQGNAEEKLKKLTLKLGLSDRVHFAGWKDHFEINKFYQLASVVLVPSRWPEPFGMVGLEAMKNNRPVIAFDAGGIRDWLVDQKTGILVPENDINAFAAAVCKLLKDQKTAELYGKNGLSRYEKNYRFDDYLNQLEKHLDSSR